ncbi:MAG: CPBP family intramembrane metalloprotease [Leptolyngbya sp.]|nr:CPBP family intramembrane metalloprotease [Candidatus Melainabacteria bacterium]
MQNFRPERQLLLNIGLYGYGALLLFSTLWCYLAEVDLAPFLIPRSKDMIIGAGAGLLLVGSSALLMTLSHLLEISIKPNAGKRIFLSMKEIALNELAPVFAEAKPFDIVLLSVLSGFCEEVFFRGALQLDFNIWIAAAVFGFFHMPTFKYLTYGIWAAAVGVFLGLLMDRTHSLWAPIVAHTLNNLLVILFLKYGPIKGTAPATEKSKD